MNSFGYLPHTMENREKMLQTIGKTSTLDLFADIPEDVLLDRPLDLPEAQSEWALLKDLKALSMKNKNVDDVISLIGCGFYQHYIPSVVDAMISRSEFYTSYTPYQPEISQGILQAIFEYQTLVARLFGQDVSNASLYDGPTALGEAALMACAQTRRERVVVSRAVHPEYREVLRTYASGQRVAVAEVGLKDGQTNLDQLEAMLTDDVAAVVVSYPNFFGMIEDIQHIAQLVHSKNALLIVATYPIALGILEAPGNLGADIVVAEGQSLGNLLSYGGPSLGMIATKGALVRRLPGRIAGQTKDHEGRRGFVLTLQAREQHIRREKASSNICSNQALNALAASIYLAYMGPQGLAEVARQCTAKAHYAAKVLEKVGVKPIFSGPFFNEFVVHVNNAAAVLPKLQNDGILFGQLLDRFYSEMSNDIVLAFTEIHTKEQIDFVAQRLEALV